MLSKPKTLALAVATTALASSVASAEQSLSSTGQVLLYPMYSTQNEANTYMHVVNNTADQKAVKMRFMEGINSAVVLEFNVYLGPYDVFPVALAPNDFGGTSVITNDATCTVPALGTSNSPYDGTQTELDSGAVLRSQPFVPYQFENDESGDISRTLIGHAEVIEMGVVSDTVDVADCKVVRDLWSSGAWASDTATNVTGPSGGLSGSSLFIVPSMAYSMDMEVTAVDGWAKAGTNYHKSPGTIKPTLEDGVSTARVNDLVLDYTSQTNGSVLATSALLASKTVFNEVQTEDVIAAETDWVVTFPTKHYFTNGTTPSAPFTAVYDSTEAKSTACETMSLTRRDRASNSSNGTGTFVPNSEGVEDKVCSAVNVLSFNGKSAIQSSNPQVISYSFQAGSATLTTDQKLPADDNGVTVQGLPVVGFAATRIANGPMSYGYAVEHKTLTVTSGS